MHDNWLPKIDYKKFLIYGVTMYKYITEIMR